VIDLARQVATVSQDESLSEASTQLATALDRGLVAASTTVVVEGDLA